MGAGLKSKLAYLSFGIALAVVLAQGCGPSPAKTNQPGADGGGSTPPGSTPDAGGPAGTDGGGAGSANDGGSPTSAAAVDPTVPTTFSDATQFIYKGQNSVQVGVAGGTIDPNRVVVLRGLVRTRDGAPSVGAAVSVVGHPEYGVSYSQSNGWFDIAANGGGLLKVNISQAGFLSVQRQAVTPWRDWVVLDDVVLTPRDSALTAVTPGAGQIQIAQSSVSSDGDGQRRATLLFPTGFSATAVLGDGSTQSLGQLHVRATEYTVGSDGPNAMPAGLPPNSGYTYAVELSIDEAEALGAAAVQFSSPVVVDVDNFVGMPVGSAVPAGSYDRQTGTWMAAPDGRVIGIVGVTGGLADLDVTGGGSASPPSALSLLGITDDERRAIAGVYPAGGLSFWRIPVSHFSPWDFNYPYGPPPDAQYPPSDSPVADDNPEPDPCQASGSIIECENQTLGERLPISGTPFALYYRSDSASPIFGGIRFTLTGSTIPSSLQAVDVVVKGVGRVFEQSFPAQTDLQYSFQWDGKDAYGRVLPGKQQFTVTIKYLYPAVYGQPYLSVAGAQTGDAGSSFGSLAAGPEQVKARAVFVYSRQYTILTGRFVSPALEFGHWTLGVHHRYQADNNTLYRGDGQRQQPIGLLSGGKIVAGGGTEAPASGMLATAANIQPSERVPLFAAAPDGSLYLLITERMVGGGFPVQRLWRVDLAGNLSVLAGYDDPSIQSVAQILANYQDDVPATQSTLQFVLGVAAASDGNIYLSEVGFKDGAAVIRRIGPDGTIVHYAGTRSAVGYGGDNGPALAATLGPSQGMAADAWGNLFIADTNANRIRRIDARGVISTFAFDGTGSAQASLFVDEGQPAISSALPNPLFVAVSQDGTLYASAGQSQIVRVGADGIARTFASGLALQDDPTTVCTFGLCGVEGLGAAPDGTLVFGTTEAGSSLFYPRVRRADASGTVTTLSARDPTKCILSGAPAAATCVGDLLGLATGPLGDTYVGADAANFILRFSTRAFENSIPSSDGTEIFLFDSSGRHLTTLNALTLATKYTFTYDANNLLATVQDGDANVTTFERGPTGALIAIRGPYGQRTTLSFDANGNLAQVTNPLGDSISMVSDSQGLLTQLRDGRGLLHTFQYDLNGRLTKDSDPLGGFTQLSFQSSTGQNYSVLKQSALGRTTSYGLAFFPEGRSRVTGLPNGLLRTDTWNLDGSMAVALPDHTTEAILQGPDPRFVMQSPLVRSRTLTTPGGLTRTGIYSVTATPGDPANPFDFSTLTSVSQINGRSSSAVFSKANLTLTTTSPAGRVSTTTFDTQGRTTSRVIAGLLPIISTYDSRGRLSGISQGTRSISRVFDSSSGRLNSVTDALGRTTSFQRDALGRPTTTTLPGARDITLSFDPNDNISSFGPPGEAVSQFSYTPVDQLATLLPPKVTSPPASPIPNPGTTFAYDADHAPILVTLPSGKTVASSYDTAGRLSTVQTSRNTVTFGYSPVGGQLSSLSDSLAQGSAPLGASIALGFDGTLLTSVTWSGAVSQSLQIAYNNDWLPATATVAGTAPVTLSYDADLLLTAATVNGVGSLALVRDATNGLPIGTTVGLVTTNTGFSQYGELASSSAQSSTATVYSTVLTRDNGGRIVTAVEQVLSTIHQYDYTYDAAGRLLTTNVDGAPSGQWSYDGNGNRLTGTAIGSLSTVLAATYDEQGRVISYGGTQYGFGPDGDLQTQVTPSGQTTYQYDSLGALTAVTLPSGSRIDYLLDALGRRVGKRVNGAFVQGFLYDGIRPIAELASPTVVKSRFIYASRPNVPDLMVVGTSLYRLIVDARGSVRLVVNATTGAVLQELDYDVWGNVLNDTNPGFQPFGFAAGLYDQDTKLLRFGARDYDATTGRWTTRDLLGFGGLDTNLYAYVGNDPVNAIDPGGVLVDGAAAAAATATAAQLAAGAGTTTLISVATATGAGLFALGLGWVAGSWLNEQFLEAPIQAFLWKNFGNDGSTAVAAPAPECSGGIQLHHPWPMYLGGPSDQLLEPLPDDLHVQYHKNIDNEVLFRAYGPQFDDLSTDDKEILYEVFGDVTREFDEQYGTNLLEAAKREGMPIP